MKDKILIYEDKGRRANFLKAVSEVRDKANELIQLYNDKQPWGRITTIEDFEDLYSDPLALFDKTLFANIDIKAIGGAIPDPKVLAELFKIDRPGFLSALGYAVTSKNDDDCPGCKKSAQTIKVQRVRTSSEFYQYAEFLYFINGTFVLNDEAIKQHADSFNVYASMPQQREIYDHWRGLVEILNCHAVKYSLGQTDKDHICKALKLLQVNGKFLINDMALSEQIKYLK